MKVSNPKKSFSMIKEANIQDGENLNIVLERSKGSICEIKRNYGYGTGFFCILRYSGKI